MPGPVLKQAVLPGCVRSVLHHFLQAAALHLFSSTPPSKIKTAIFGSVPRAVSCDSPSRNCTVLPTGGSRSSPLLFLAKGTACVPANAAEPPIRHPLELQM